MNYRGLKLTVLTKRGAETWTRLVYGVPDHVGLGWTPYRYIVQSDGGALSYKAFRTAREFQKWRRNAGLRIAHFARYHAQGRNSWAVASADLIA